MVLDVGYTGDWGYNQQLSYDINPIPIGTRAPFTASNADPTNGGKTLPDILLRTVYPGFNTINGYAHLGSSNQSRYLGSGLRTQRRDGSARRMARPGSRVMALIGNGAQSEFQAIAFHRMMGVRNPRLYDTDPQATSKLMRNLESLQLPGLEVTRCASTADAVRGADVVTTATADKRNAIILTPQMIEPGMHLNAVGGDCPGKTELHPEILHAQDVRIVVEFEPQARIEGEIQQLGAVDELGAVRTVTELADVVRGKLPGRANEREVTIFDSVGFALNDFSSLRYLRRLNAEQPDGGQRIDLIPELDDPKDLFAGLSPEHAQERAKIRRRRFA